LAAAAAALAENAAGMREIAVDKAATDATRGVPTMIASGKYAVGKVRAT